MVTTHMRVAQLFTIGLAQSLLITGSRLILVFCPGTDLARKGSPRLLKIDRAVRTRRMLRIVMFVGSPRMLKIDRHVRLRSHLRLEGSRRCLHMRLSRRTCTTWVATLFLQMLG